MSYVHERAFYFGAYWVVSGYVMRFRHWLLTTLGVKAQSIFTAILNAASTYEAVYLDWTWYYWVRCIFRVGKLVLITIRIQIFAILAAVGTVMIILICPETKFARPAFAIDGQLTKVDEYGNLVVLSDEEAKGLGGSADNVLRTNDEEDSRNYTYMDSLSLIQPINKSAIRVALQSYWQMLLALTNPAIVWALGAASAVLAVTISQSLSFGSILGRVYHWKEENVGLVYLGALPAAALAFLTCGWGGDKLNLWFARRNGGVHLPEHRVSSNHPHEMEWFLAHNCLCVWPHSCQV